LFYISVTYGWNPWSNFNSMPRTVREAEMNGWKLIGGERGCSNGGKYKGYRYIKGEDISIALLYDVNGIIAGMQMNVRK